MHSAISLLYIKEFFNLTRKFIASTGATATSSGNNLRTPSIILRNREEWPRLDTEAAGRSVLRVPGVEGLRVVDACGDADIVRAQHNLTAF